MWILHTKEKLSDDLGHKLLELECPGYILFLLFPRYEYLDILHKLDFGFFSYIVRLIIMLIFQGYYEYQILKRDLKILSHEWF